MEVDEDEHLRLASADEEVVAELAGTQRGLAETSRLTTGSDARARERPLPAPDKWEQELTTEMADPTPRVAPRGIGFSRRTRNDSLLNSTIILSPRRQFQTAQSRASLAHGVEPEPAPSSTDSSHSKRQKLFELENLMNACALPLSFLQRWVHLLVGGERTIDGPDDRDKVTTYGMSSRFPGATVDNCLTEAISSHKFRPSIATRMVQSTA